MTTSGRNAFASFLCFIYPPVKVGVIPPFGRDVKSWKPREREKVYELINRADGANTFLQTQFDLAETLLVLDGFLALGLLLVILSSVWSAANLDNLVCSDHCRPHSR